MSYSFNATHPKEYADEWRKGWAEGFAGNDWSDDDDAPLPTEPYQLGHGQGDGDRQDDDDEPTTPIDAWAQYGVLDWEAHICERSRRRVVLYREARELWRSVYLATYVPKQEPAVAIDAA